MALCVRAERFDFVNECEISHRMYQRYKRLKALGLLVATREPGDGNPCFRVRQLTFEEASDQFTQAGNLQAITALIKLGEKMKHKHECFNQPLDGWQVHSVRRECRCDQWFKHRVCVHVAHACTIDQKECPGLPKPKRRFVNPTVRPRRRNVRARQDASQTVRPQGRNVRARRGGSQNIAVPEHPRPRSPDV